MPRYSALTIPNPIEGYQRLRALSRQTREADLEAEDRALSRQDRALARDDAARERRELAAMRDILSTVSTPEDFARVYHELVQINPVAAMDMKARWDQLFGRKGPLVRNKAGVMVPESEMIGQEPWTEPRPPVPVQTGGGMRLVPNEPGDITYPANPPPTPPSEPLVPVDEGGRPIYRPRTAAIGKPQYVAPAAEVREATTAQRARAAQWRTETLLKLQDQFKAQQVPGRRDAQGQLVLPMTRAEYDLRRVAIQQTAVEMAGPAPERTLGAVNARPGGATVSPSRPAPAPVAAAAPTAPGSRLQVGQIVTVRGQRYRVKKVYPDGSWDPE